MTRTLPLSLLDPPAEVRLRIYHFLIPQGHRFCIHRNDSPWVLSCIVFIQRGYDEFQSSHFTALRYPKPVL